MPICIECRYPVKTLYTEYSAADDRSSGHGVRLTQCPRCKRFADKYVEMDFVVLFIDLVLIKPQVYRHLLFNSLAREDNKVDPSIIRLGILLLLFDVYLTWARIEKQTPDETKSNPSNFGALSQQPIFLQYMFFCEPLSFVTLQSRLTFIVMLCAFSTISFHLSIRFLTSSPLSPLHWFGLLPTYAKPNSVSTALLVSSSTKLFPILMVIWDYDVPAAARSLGWAVVANNVEALKILLDCGYGTAGILASVGALSRWTVGRGILWAVGLEDGVGDSGVASDGMALWALIDSVRAWGGWIGFG